MKALIYVHGKGGSAAEAEHYKPLFPDCEVIGFDYQAATPWEAKDEFSAFFGACRKNHASLCVAANSIGAFFTMQAAPEGIERAFFISPIVDMERLIADMLTWAGTTEAELRERKVIHTDFGETLSWEYLCYVREHPLHWEVPTAILYGTKDHLTSRETISAFAARQGAALTVMENGEHWFHTAEQMAFLDRWMREQT